MSDDTSTAQALRELGAACLGHYRCLCPANTLYEQACHAAGDRASALLRRYFDAEAMVLSEPIPADDVELFRQAGWDCLALSGMVDGQVSLSADELCAMAAELAIIPEDL